MKKYLLISLVLVFLVFFIPWLAGEDTPSAAEPPGDERSEQPETDTPRTEHPPLPALPDGDKVTTGERDGSVTITVLVGETVVEMDLGSYLVGVVRAEMPASFETEALKAQAVAARTYTLYKIAAGGSANHPDADTCTDINCCKAYMDSESAAALWGERAAEYEEKIRSAVTATDGECVLYGGEPVLAVFHSSSAGMTMDSQVVWSGSLPYLKSVASPETENTVPNFHSEASFGASVLRGLLLEALPEAKLEGSASNWFSDLHIEKNGTVTALCVGGVEVSGNKLRTILGLRSACFTISFSGGDVVFSVMGYGHGVGMSQYGANLLAKDGMSYREILTWYYTDTTVEVYSKEEQ